MEIFVKILIYIHATAGTLALVSGPVAMLTRKGGPGHRLWGRLYFYGMTGVFATAVVVAIYKNLVFLLMIAFFSYYLVCSGYRALYLKKLSKGQKPAKIDWILNAVTIIFSFSLFIWGVNTYFFRHDSFGMTGMVFGALSLLFIYRNVKKLLFPPKDDFHWIYSHIMGMGGGYIATFTAFLVVNATFNSPLLVWLSPTVIGTPIIMYTNARLRRKYVLRKHLETVATKPSLVV